MARRWAYTSQRTSRPRTAANIRTLVIRLATENREWEHRRVQGELAGLGYRIAPSTVWQILTAAGIDPAPRPVRLPRVGQWPAGLDATVREILREAGMDPAPDRAATTWAAFLRCQAEALLAADLIQTVTLTWARTYILAVIEHASRRVRILGATAHQTATWVTQAARNLSWTCTMPESNVRYLIRDRDGTYPALFDTILADAGSRSYAAASRYPG